MTAYAKILKENPKIKAYLVYYGRYCADCGETAVYSKDGEYLGLKPKIYLDTDKEISDILKKERKSLNKKYGIPKDRITIINGGFKRWREIELWIIPENGEIPKPKPEIFPNKKK